MTLIQKLRSNALYIAWVQAMIATLGSLAFSFLGHLPPCELCWYQRIMMYPLALIIGLIIVKPMEWYRRYILPLAIIGWAIALYHNLLYYKILPHSLAPCTAGVSCTTKTIEWLGFITIPLLSWLAFSLIIAATLWHKPAASAELPKAL